MDSITDLGVGEKSEISCIHRDSNPGPSSTSHTRYTDYITPERNVVVVTTTTTTTITTTITTTTITTTTSTTTTTTNNNNTCSVSLYAHRYTTANELKSVFPKMLIYLLKKGKA